MKEQKELKKAEDIAETNDAEFINRHVELQLQALQKIIQLFAIITNSDKPLAIPDPKLVWKSILPLFNPALLNPNRIVEMSNDLMVKLAAVSSRILDHHLLQQEMLEKTVKKDKRFQSELWTKEMYSDFISDTYLMLSDWLTEYSKSIPLDDDKGKKRLIFFTRQVISALSPANFLITNPEAVKEGVETRGLSLLKGMNSLLDDLIAGEGRLQLKLTDMTKFEHGKNVALTEGSVVYQNDLMQLIQYKATTAEVYDTPLLFIPAWINKYYIFDLTPRNSFIQWAVNKGHTVFCISWVNPTKELENKNFADYVTEGPLAAIEVIQNITGAKKVNIIGYCIGGTLLASTLAYAAAKKDDRIQSATTLASLTDFSEPGDIGAFLEEDQIQQIEKYMEEKGYLEGFSMATMFNMLRENDLIWSNVKNQYLLGRDPMPFDLLFWNSDATNMPRAMQSFYLQNMYLKNKLKDVGGITINGVPLNLRDIKVPYYIVATIDDHIALWTSVFKTAQLLTAPTRFVLGGSGHIAGVINPEAANKYCYWTNPQIPKSAKEWLENAQQIMGSWWKDWAVWADKLNGGKKVPARKVGNKKYKPLEPAPGSYVKVSWKDKKPAAKTRPKAARQSAAKKK